MNSAKRLFFKRSLIIPTEAETRRDKIDGKLREAGWDLADPSQVSIELTIWTKKFGGIDDFPPTPASEVQFAELGTNFPSLLPKSFCGEM